jgi:enoyl-CoA hydratase/carnithine racemase
VAVRLAKRAIDSGYDLPMSEALAVEWDCYQGVLDTEDRIEALRAFSEKRRPVFRGR